MANYRRFHLFSAKMDYLIIDSIAIMNGSRLTIQSSIATFSCQLENSSFMLLLESFSFRTSLKMTLTTLLRLASLILSGVLRNRWIL